MLRILAALTLAVCALGFGVRAAADQGQTPPSGQAADPRAALLKRLPAGSKLEDLRPSPIPGIYEFMQGAEISYLTADGKYFLDGNLYDMDSRENLTEVLRTRARFALISAVPESEMVIFGPKNPLYTITVFTDVDCGYCRKLHSEMAELNRLGVRVRYMFYPRTGPNTESWKKAEVVWCSPNRNEALTRREKRRSVGYEQDLRCDAGRPRIRLGPKHRRARHARHRDGTRRLHFRLYAAARTGAANQGSATGEALRRGRRSAEARPAKR